VDLQQEALAEARTYYLPRIEAYYWRLWARPDPHEATNIAWDSQWQAGLALTWSLFDGLAREGKIVQRRAELRRQQILLSDAEERALLEISSALFELQNARELVESQRLNLERADKALSLVQTGYREGVNTQLEVLDATAALTAARGLYYRALHRHTLARIGIQKAMGLLGPRPGIRKVPGDVGPIGSLPARAAVAPDDR